ncbi:MAG: preprotein translocase subunit YajC [Pseudomonadota bacterium]
MWISKAYAQGQEAIEGVSAETMAMASEAPSAANAFAWNMGLIFVLVFMFYFLLIRPQQKRFKEHQDMVDSLKKGDKVVTAGGLVGKIHKITAGNDEVIIDLGETKVTVMRSSLQAQLDKEPAAKAVKKDEKKK